MYILKAIPIINNSLDCWVLCWLTKYIYSATNGGKTHIKGVSIIFIIIFSRFPFAIAMVACGCRMANVKMALLKRKTCALVSMNAVFFLSSHIEFAFFIVQSI